MNKKLAKPDADNKRLLGEVRSLIVEARNALATAVNAGLTLLYWNIGKRIQQEILKGERAAYGEQVIAGLAAQLGAEYGGGFGKRNLFNMLRFAEVFPDDRIVHALRAQLSWTHFKAIIYFDDPLKRDFYAEMCRIERWSTRTLQERIDSMLFERTALSKQPEALIQTEMAALRDSDRLSPELVFRDPYVLDFLGLNDRYLEKDLEDAIMRDLENFLLEMGGGFSFIARQKRITVDHEDYYIDLLFYHRDLQCLVVVDLKIGDFKPADKGQMELYLRWLDKYEKRPGENRPLGIVLCAGKRRESVELLELAGSSIHVAEYLTVLPPRDVFVARLHRAIADARERMTRKVIAEQGGAE